MSNTPGPRLLFGIPKPAVRHSSFFFFCQDTATFCDASCHMHDSGTPHSGAKMEAVSVERTASISCLFRSPQQVVR